MGVLQSYSAFLVRHPAKLLIATSIGVALLFGLALWLRPIQSFNDPLVGFEARGTDLGLKINTWKLLNDETSASANNISLLPNWHRYDGSYSQAHWNHPGPDKDQNLVLTKNTTDEPEPPIIESSIQKLGNQTYFPDESSGQDDELDEYEISNITRSGQPILMHHSLDSSKAFCGMIYEGYAQAVVSPSHQQASQGLFHLESLRAICHLDRRLRLEHSPSESYLFQEVCEQYQEGQNNETISACCNSWSLPNYIACLNDKPTCMDITSRDLKNFEQLLDLCIPYYLKAPYDECFSTISNDASPTTPRPLMSFLNSDLPVGGEHRSLCGQPPSECYKCGGWTYNVLHFLTSENFLKHRPQANPANSEASNRIRPSSRLNVIGSSKEININKLTHTNIFLPMAKSASLMKYYLALARHNLKTPQAQVKVLNLGLKNSLFEHLISDDMKLFIIALVSILLVISIYTWSFILSLVILLIICLSLCLSYTIYELVLDIAIFPFMNLLAVVISFGICSDNAMLFCRHWTLSREQLTPEHQRKSNGSGNTNDEHAIKNHTNLELMLQKAILSTSAATLATACSFIISAISKVTAVKCFCIFATLSVITNYLLIILLLPPALILDARLKEYLAKFIGNKDDRLTRLSNGAQSIRGKILEFGDSIHMKVIYVFITRFKFYLIITFITLLICASILVFHGPSLQPADDEIQLLTKKHAFEQYDKNLKRQFAFERVKQGELIAASHKFMQDPPDTLPIRVVFGLRPVDNGDHFEPQDRGTLEFDTNFDLAEPNSQIWMLDFCQKLRNQRFIHPPMFNDMSSCFMVTFKSWMERSCEELGVDRSPCCRTSEFPFSRYIFNKCMLEAVSIIRRSPHLNSNTNAGIRFHKNSTRIAAIIVEYQSNRIYSESFAKMDRFYSEINDWITWHVNNTAPPGMKSGWFISNHLDLLSLQLELEQSTNVSVFLEVVFAMVALLISTRDIFLTVAGTLTICTIIIVILAILVLLRWTLGVAESILISLTIGLSIDFALHYSVAYSEGVRSRTSHGVIQRILNEVGSPIALATTTTTLAGFVIVWSDILAYQELGTFLMLIALISWLSSTLFLLPMLATFDSIIELSEQYTRMLLLRAHKMLIGRL